MFSFGAEQRAPARSAYTFRSRPCERRVPPPKKGWTHGRDAWQETIVQQHECWMNHLWEWYAKNPTPLQRGAVEESPQTNTFCIELYCKNHNLGPEFVVDSVLPRCNIAQPKGLVDNTQKVVNLLALSNEDLFTVYMRTPHVHTELKLAR